MRVRKVYFVDANIFLRFLQKDNSIQSPKTKRLFQDAQKGKIKLITNSLIIAELIWVLESVYKLDKEEVSEKIKLILVFKGLEIFERNLLLSAVDLYQSNNFDFADAYTSIWMRENKINSIYSFDRDFDKVENITRIEPS